MDHTDEYIKEISEKIDSKKDYYAEISNKIWEFAEPRFQEYRSSELLQHVLKQAGFSIKADLAGEKTAFIAEYGSGKPVIAFLGEFDALPGLSQKADAAERIPANTGSCGHGCGHQLIGTGTLASVIALKDFVKEHNLQGTIRYYGCPAEENAGGKAFLVRDGYFNDCDLALCWHPEQGRRACYGSTKANFRVFFTFHGTSAHASMCPELGRSALDAVELMDVGVNYMREHMIDEARIHYAITDTGGDAPNVVQSRAQVLYAHFRSLLINLFCKSFILFSAMDYSIFCLELQCLFGAFCFYHISGFKSFGNGLGYVSPFRVFVSSSLALFTNSGFCRKSMAVRAMILAA